VSAGISFVGAGPGATDLITVRGARRIGEADVVLWTPAIADSGWVRENAKPEAELVEMTRQTDDEITEVYRRAVRDKLRVVRLIPGDPATWAGLRAQLDICARVGLTTDVVPGVSPVSAAAVSVGVSLVEPEYADSVISVVSGGQETTGMPDLAQIKEYAQFGTTMTVLVPAARAAELADALRGGGYDDETPIVAAYKVSWQDEIVVRTTVGELVATVKQHRLWRHTLFLIGGAVRAGRARTNGEAPRRPESVARWSRSKSSWLEAKRTERSEKPEQAEEPAPQRETVTAIAVPEPESVPQPAPEPLPEKKTVPVKAAAASTATKSVTAQASPAALRKPTTKAAAAKAAAAKATNATTTGKPAVKAAAKKSSRAQPQRGRRS
jgi:precorrin-4/cobalt-precorrin-4 C11-methyltransferase